MKPLQLCYTNWLVIHVWSAELCAIKHWPLPFLSTSNGTVWGEGASFPGSQCVLGSPRRRLGLGGGRGVLPGGGFHLRHHQELWHLPSGPHDRVWGDQQSGPLDRFHLRVCHDIQWWVDDCERNHAHAKWSWKGCPTIEVFSGSAGPLSSVLTNRFGFQFVVMVGGSLIAIGTIATSFTSSVNQMYLTYGLVAGNSLKFFVSFLSVNPGLLTGTRFLKVPVSTLQGWATAWHSCPPSPFFHSTSPVDGHWSQLWLPLGSPCPCLHWHQVRRRLRCQKYCKDVGSENTFSHCPSISYIIVNNTLRYLNSDKWYMYHARYYTLLLAVVFIV